MPAETRKTFPIPTSKENEIALLNFTSIEIRKITNAVAGQKSFSLRLPTGSINSFFKELKRLYSDEEKGIPAYAEALGKEIPSLRIINPLQADFKDRFDELKKNRDEYARLTPWKYSEQIHELNVWVNPDGIDLNDPEDAAVFIKAAKYGQNIFLFDHPINHSQISKELVKALGAETSFKLIIEAK